MKPSTSKAVVRPKASEKKTSDASALPPARSHSLASLNHHDDKCSKGPLRLQHAALLAALSLGTPALAATCDLPEQLLDIRVSGGARGSAVVRLRAAPDGTLQVLLPPALFKASEAAIIGAQVTCDDQVYVSPSPAARVRYDEGQQSLSISLPPALLGGHTLNLTGQGEQGALPATPSLGVAFGLNTQTNVQGGLNNLPYNAQAYVGVGYANGPLSAYADLSAARQGLTNTTADWRFEPRAIARYALNPRTALTAAWNVDPDYNTPEFTNSSFRGLNLTGQAGFDRALPEWHLDLPLDADVEVQVDGVTVSRATVGAGVLTITGVNVSKIGGHVIRAYITDDNGTREENLDLPSTNYGIPAGALLYSATAGWRNSAAYASANAEYGLTPNLSVRAQALYTPSTHLLSTTALYAQKTFDASFGVSYAWDGLTNQDSTQALLSGNVYRGNWQFNGQLSVPVTDYTQTTLGLGAIYSSRDWVFSGRYTQSFTALNTNWRLNADVIHTFNDRASLTASAAVQQGSYRVGLRLGYLLNPQWRFGLDATAGTAGQAAGAEVRYTPSPASTIDARVEYPGYARVGYRYAREIDAQLFADTTGSIQGSAKGALTLSGGQLSVQPALPQRAILVRTGIPNLPILLDGLQAAVTNAQGDALITTVTSGRSAEIAVSLRDLPITIAVASERQRIVPPVNGLVTLDWRDNFRVFRFVQFRWSATETAVNADVIVNGERIALDDEGNGLLPASADVVTGTLTSQDNARTCTFTLRPQQEQTQCQPAP